MTASPSAGLDSVRLVEVPDQPASGRVRTDGRFLRLEDRPFRVRGATYGTFVPRGDGALYPEPSRTERDLRALRAAGLNTVRVYTAPPDDVLDVAGAIGLRLIVGLAYDDWRMHPAPGRRTDQRVLDAGLAETERAMARLAGHPCVLAVSVGNEVPGDVVRLHGIGRIEHTLSDLVEAVHEADPDMLVTYTNFPTTEYLQVTGQDIATFNVFLERPRELQAYLRRLQVVSGPVPLVLTEVGLAGEVHGSAAQAEALRWQLETVDDTGCAGATVFSWTDEWGVAGQPVEGWGFGITDVHRRPKPALSVVRQWAGTSIQDRRDHWPRVSVIVCAYDEQDTIEECLRSLAACSYPDLEVIVCDDGSTDQTAALAREFPFRLLELPHGGLSAARNAGLESATGSIVAYLDADAACHPEWPFHLALSLEDDGIVATGGPNLPVADAGLVERAVARSPGAPVEVLASHDRAEHVPGCNMAYRAGALRAVGGFDVAYTAAGDDVDVCWKLLDEGHQIGFSAAAQVRHHRRATVRGYLRQQRGYGRAEKMLSGPHAPRFNRLGQARWGGVIYGNALARLLHPVIYHGYLGAAPFQGVVRHRGEVALARVGAFLPLVVPLALVGIVVTVVLPALGLGMVLGAVVLTAGYAGIVTLAVVPGRDEPTPGRLRVLVGLLHLLQPFARAWGRVRASPLPAVGTVDGEWTGDRAAWLETLRRELGAVGAFVRVATPEHPWDMEASCGPFAKARVTTAVTWAWVPHQRVQVRPRTAAYLVVLGVTVATLGGLTWTAWPAVVAMVGTDVGRLRRRVSRALARTTYGAEST